MRFVCKSIYFLWVLLFNTIGISSQVFSMMFSFKMACSGIMCLNKVCLAVSDSKSIIYNEFRD